jgi:hypothetical protein
LRVGIAAVVRQEARYLKEWIAYHQAVGITDFFIADDGGDDGTSDLLRSMADAKLIVRVEFDRAKGGSPQLSAYRHILRHYGCRVHWLAFIDADEFICQRSGVKVPQVLFEVDAHPSIGAIAMNWAVYGSSGHLTASDDLVVGRFDRRAPQAHAVNMHYKSIAKTHAIREIGANPHYLELADGYRYAHADGSAMTDGVGRGLSSRVVWGPLRLNHYVIKSLEEFKVKQARGRATTSSKRPDQFFAAHDLNHETDPMPRERVDLTRQYMKVLEQKLRLEALIP